MSYTIICELISFVECFLLFFLAKSIFLIKPNRQWFYYVALLIDYGYTVWGDFHTFPEVLFLAGNLLLDTVLLTLVCRGTVRDTLLLVFGYYIGIMLVDLIVYMSAQNVIPIDENSLYDQNLSNSILSIISKAVCCMCVFFFIRKYNAKKEHKYFHISAIVFLIPVISIWMLCILLDYSLNVKLSFYQYVLFYITMAGILILNIFLGYFCEAVEQNQQRKIKIEMLQQEREYYEELKKSYEQVKRVKHDFDKQINVMEALVRNREYEQLERFFESERMHDIGHPDRDHSEAFNIRTGEGSMELMWKRMWKANRIFSFLFLLSFTVTFCIVYYGMFLGSQLQQANSAAAQSGYDYRGYYTVTWTENVEDRLQVDLPDFEQGILSYRLSVDNGEDIVGVKQAYIVMEMHENFMEPLAEGRYFTGEIQTEYPQCIVGDAWLRYAKKTNDTTLVNVSGYDCQVVGVLQTNTFRGSDERIFLYGQSMTQEFLANLINMNQSIAVDYRITESADNGQVEKYEEWLESGLFEDVESFDIAMVDGGVDIGFGEVMPIYNRFFELMMILCLVNCIFLTYVWCVKKTQENMIKRVFGFGMTAIWREGLKEIVLYEFLSLVLSSIICILIELCRGEAGEFFTVWRDSAKIMVFVVLVFTFLLSMVNVFYIRKISPADTLKASE